MPAIVSKITAHPHRFVAFIGVFTLFMTVPLSALFVFLTLNHNQTQTRAATPSIPLIDAGDVVAITISTARSV